MKRIFWLLLVAIFFINCSENSSILPAEKEGPLINFVNPFIGTGAHGHTYPGATMPFGMMQLSPDTRLEGWDGCSGYHYTDSYIYGFSHTHLSGTGISDYGDILLMPTNEVVFNNGADGKKGYRAHFSHDNEVAEPGYYKVHLDTTNIDVQLTVSKRSGIHKYQFPSSENQIVILDLEHRDKLLDHKLQFESPTEISGYRHSEAWATNQQVYFNIKTSHPVKDWDVDYETWPTKEALVFNNPNNEPVYIKIGISAVDEEGAKKNLEEEVGTKSFEEVKNEAQAAWEKQLEKIIIESDNIDYKTNFYTAMYHTMVAPNIYQDVDGRYRGMDLEIHQTNEFDYYTVFSLWDTYRAANPLYTIIEPERTNHFINTFLAKYDEGGIMPMWDLSACYTGCMIGYHAVPVIADAYLKGIRGYDTNKAFEAMKHSATRDKLGLTSYKSLGFIPVEEESESVSKTLEYAYDDWTIAQMAKAMGNEDDFKTYNKRAQFYKNVYDPNTKFMRGRFRNSWFAPFDPFEVNFNYTEANSWQYSFYVPQDISGFIKLLGGKEQLENNLDQLFTAETETSGRHQSDITGLIGQYAHGNEPSHHMAYLYNFVNKPQKTQERIRQILTELYLNTPEGISGNEDCGQMSAWYILSSLGFYSVTPASNEYVIGGPLFKKATINLENGNQFTIVGNNNSETNKYIKSASLNGKPLDKTFITHENIVNGGSLVFEMTNTPSEWGTKEGQEPKTAIIEDLIVPAPFFTEGNTTFRGQTTIALGATDKESKIFYQIGKGEFEQFEKPFEISNSEIISIYAQKDEEKSAIITTEFIKIDPNLSITLESTYADQYSAGGDDALIDGIRGSKDFRTGIWQGYGNEDLIATLNLGQLKEVSNVQVNFLQDQQSWIFYPREVHYLASTDNKNFRLIDKKVLDPESRIDEARVENIIFKHAPTTYQYIKIVAKKLGVVPEWHVGYEDKGTGWIFVDEISVN